MKKMRVFFLMFASFFLLLCACSQQEDLGNATDIPTTVAIDLQISNPMGTQTKAGALEGDDEEVQYCAESIPDEGVVEFSFNVKYDDGTTEDFGIQTYPYNASNLNFNAGEGAIGTLSGLFKLEFPSEVKQATVTVTDFRVFDTAGTLLFLTPKTESAYAGYVTTAVDYSETVDIYEKQYIKMDVLCFNEEKIPEFGFTWFDFNVVTGDEICVFFNCLGQTADTRHQVFAAKFEAKYWNGSQWITYWEGINYNDGVAPSEVKPMCIPCPGNWKTADGLKLDIIPMGHGAPLQLVDGEVATLTITKEQIIAFLDSQEESWGDISTGDDFEMEIAVAAGAPFMHYTFADCNKPLAYYSNTQTEGGTSDIYGLTLGADNAPVISKIFTTEENFEASIAMTPDETMLIMMNRFDPTTMVIYDIYTLKTITLNVDQNGIDKMAEMEADENMEPYAFTQLVYIDEQLYAGCEANKCLVPINFDVQSKEYSFVTDIVEEIDDSFWPWNDDLVEPLIDGDLLASNSAEERHLYNFSDFDGAVNWRQHMIIRYSEIYSEVDAQHSYVGGLLAGYTNPLALDKVSGVCLVSLENGSTAAISSQHINNNLTIKVWQNGSELAASEFTNVNTGPTGDLASAFKEITSEEIDQIFGITEWRDDYNGWGD